MRDDPNQPRSSDTVTVHLWTSVSPHSVSSPYVMWTYLICS